MSLKLNAGFRPSWVALAAAERARGNFEAAIAAYRVVATSQDAGYLAARAAIDVEYLQWKLDYAERQRRRQPRTPADDSASESSVAGEGDAP